MEIIKTAGFCELSQNEMQSIDGGSINWKKVVDIIVKMIPVPVPIIPKPHC